MVLDELPVATTGIAVSSTITKDGTVYVDGVRTALDKLSSVLDSVRGDNDKAEVVVKADEKAKSSIILEIMDAAQDAHYKKLIVAGEPLNKKEQKELMQNDIDDNNTLNSASTPLPTDGYESWND